jgi:diguanylate cyclase (GGDEF)-like protein
LGGEVRANRDKFELLVSSFANHGLESFLESTRSLVVLLSEGGNLIAWNRCFDPLQDTLQNISQLRDFLSPSSRTLFDLLLSTATHDRIKSQGQLNLGQGDRLSEYNCTLLPIPGGHLLFIAEPTHIKSETEEAQAELHKMKQLLARKETELQAVIAQADEVSHTDALTFLPNRRQVMIDLQNAVEFSERYGTPLTVSMIDIDHFKKINDTHGHATGDEVLRSLAGNLRNIIRHPDTIGRFGGEEFLIVLPHSTTKAAMEQAGRLCEQIRSSPIQIGEKEIIVTVSMGIAQYKIHKEDWQSLLNRADAALYQAKNNGRDQWVISEE